MPPSRRRTLASSRFFAWPGRPIQTVTRISSQRTIPQKQIGIGNSGVELTQCRLAHACATVPPLRPRAPRTDAPQLRPWRSRSPQVDRRRKRVQHVLARRSDTTTLEFPPSGLALVSCGTSFLVIQVSRRHMFKESLGGTPPPSFLSMGGESLFLRSDPYSWVGFGLLVTDQGVPSPKNV